MNFKDKNWHLYIEQYFFMDKRNWQDFHKTDLDDRLNLFPMK